jgi:cytochrome c oxidase subunit 3
MVDPLDPTGFSAATPLPGINSATGGFPEGTSGAAPLAIGTNAAPGGPFAGGPHGSGSGDGSGAAEHAHGGYNLTGFLIFLASESLIFAGLFAAYIVLKGSAPLWLPPGVEGLEVREPLINTIVLVSSSGVAWLAERALHRRQLVRFRLWWLLTMAMGSWFVVGQAREWMGLPFSLGDGVFGACFYLLTGFHGLHVITGVLLMALMLWRSFRPGNYNGGEAGVTSVGLFWHFVDVIWIALFALLYLWQGR